MLRLLHLPSLLLWLSLLAVAVTAAPRALAQDDPETETARQRFQEGVKHFDAGQFAKARVAFVQAYALKQHPAVLLNLAQSELRTPGHEAIAAQHFTEYLRLTPDSAKRAEAEGGLEKAKSKIATVTVTVDRPGAKLLVDGEVYGTSPMDGPMFLKPGSYAIEARSGDDSQTRSFEASAGEDASLDFVLDSGKTQAGTAAAAPARDDGEQPREEPPAKSAKEPRERSVSTEGRPPFFRWLFRRPLATLLGVVTVGGVGAGVGLQVVAQSEYDEARETKANIIAVASSEGLSPELTGQAPCGDREAGIPPIAAFPGDTRYYDQCTAWVSTQGRGDDLFVGSMAGFGAATLGAVGLVTYYLVDTRPGRDRDDSARTLRVTPVITAGGSSLAISGRF